MKKHSILSFLCAAGLIISTLPISTMQNFSVYAEESESESPMIIENGILVNGKKCEGDVVIPEGVTAIGNNAFYNCTSITSVIIPEGVTKIGDSAFFGCSNLIDVSIPNSVKTIEPAAFSCCTSLPMITLPDGITELKDGTFHNCDSLAAIEIPESVESIGFMALPSYCPWMNEKRAENPLVIVNGILIDGTTCEGAVTIPESVKTIGSSAFQSSSITSVTIENGVETIEGAAFMFCSQLTAVSIPDSVTAIKNSVFYDCTSLSEINLPDTLSYIGCDVFNNTPWLQAQREINPLVVLYGILIDGSTCEGEVVIPNNVTRINARAFYHSSTVTDVVVSDSVTSIGEQAFMGRVTEGSPLKSVIIPNSVTSIEAEAFQYCTALEKITLPDSITSIPSHAFRSCRSLTSVTIPEGITYIGGSAFDDCLSLTTVVLPESLTEMEGGIFYMCSSLQSIVIPKHVKAIERGTFYNCKKLESVTIENPYCTVFDVDYTISNGKGDDKNYTYTGIIYGYEGSPAQEYADKYGYTFVSIGEMPELLKGDINGDSEFTTADIILLQKWLLAIPETHLVNWKAADFYEDERLDVFDMCFMKKELLNR